MAVMMTIPDAMRLPLTFGLSGALHVAAMSGFGPPPSVGVAEHPVQVLLFEGTLAPATGPIAPSAPAAETAQKPDPEPADESPASIAAPSPAATPAGLPVDAVTTPETAVAAPRSGMPAESAHDSTPSDPAASSDVSPSTRTHTAETRPAAAASDPPGRPGIASHPAPGIPAGTLASPLPAPKAVRTPAPEYPEEARWEKRTGLATLGFRVEADGSVAEVRMLHSSGHADLDAAALESLRHWRFTLPAGATPSSWYRYVFRFELT
jgi:protein TonB